MFFILFCGSLQKHLPYLQTIRNPAAYFYQLRPGLSSLPAMFFILFCCGLQKHLPYLQTIRNPAACFYQLRPVELFAFFIFSSTLQRLAKAFAVFANHPQSSGMFLSVTTSWLFAFFIFSSTLWRFGKLPELLAGFTRPPMLSHIFPYLPISSHIYPHTGVRFTTPVFHILRIRGQWYILATPSPPSGAFFTCRIHREEVFLYSKS